MQNRLPAIIGGIVSLLITGVCCLSGIGLYFYQAFAARAAVEPPAFVQTSPPSVNVPPIGTPPSFNTPAVAVPLITNQRSSNYGSAVVTPGVNPTPVAIVSGATQASSVGFGTLGLQAVNSGACRGYGTAQPDYIVDVASPLSTMNLVVASDGDPTLVVHHAGRYWCSDDDGDAMNPLLQLTGVEAGQYDVWVGSYSATQNINTTLSITQ